MCPGYVCCLHSALHSTKQHAHILRHVVFAAPAPIYSRWSSAGAAGLAPYTRSAPVVLLTWKWRRRCASVDMWAAACRRARSLCASSGVPSFTSS